MTKAAVPARLVEPEDPSKSDAIQPRAEQGRTSEEQDPAGTIVLGEWYWVLQTKSVQRKGYDDFEDVLTETSFLACVTKLGTNYAEVTYIRGRDERVHFDSFWERCKYEPEWRFFVDAKVKQLQQEIYNVLQETKETIEGLGLHGSAVPESDTALATMSSARNLDSHKKALVRAKDKKLPELEKAFKDKNEMLADYLAAPVLPMRALTVDVRNVVKRIEGQIFNVELYAGLVESVVPVKKGQPAPVGKLHLMQRMHYMDEECLVNYQAGGMTYRSIGEFERWLRRKEIFERIFPFPRCVVAFRVRRQDYRCFFTGFIDFHFGPDPDKQTFLYIRNGGQLHRLATSLDFKHRLFPERKDLLLGEGQLYAKSEGYKEYKFISEADYQALVEKWQQQSDDDRRWHHRSPREWSLFNREDLHYDEMCAGLQQNVEHYNRVALVLQGLFDRSEVLHPHPKVELWNTAGFTKAIELVYDVDLSITDGDPSDFEAYRARLNQTLKTGSMTVGQMDAWMREEAKRENDRQRYSRNSTHYERYQPYGNPGPGVIARVEHFARTKTCSYAWERDRSTYVPRWNRGAGYREKLPCHIKLPASVVLNVDAYEIGDFKQFYNDPRTREDYIKWAPYLLAAENYKAGKHKEDE